MINRPTVPEDRSWLRWPRIVLPALLLAWLCSALITSARTNSVTVDEFAHLPAGLVYWQTGDFSVYRHNPPLVRLLAAAPVAAAGVRAPGSGYNRNRWELGRLFQQALGERYHETFLPARLVIAVLTLLTALLLYIVTRRALGWEPGLLALALFCFNPTVLAHGALVTTDAGFGLAFFAVCVAGARFFRRPSGKTSVLLGVFLGVALLTKFTAQLLLPLLLLAALTLPLLARWLRDADGLGWLDLTGGQRWLRLTLVLLVALFVLDAGYLFHGVGRPLAAYPPGHRLFDMLASSPLGALPCPLPTEYLLGFNDQYREASGGFSVYLLGRLTTSGWWYYYPLALVFKLPLMFFLLFGALVGAIASRRLPLTLLLVGSLAVPVFSLACFVLFTNIDIGVRYLFFLAPFASIALAHLARPPLTRGRRVLLGGCLALYAAGVVANHPNSIGYFSEICGGPARGYRFLADSNLDWGQDLLRLRRYMAERAIASVALSHFGPVDPAAYGVKYTGLQDPAGPATVVISVNHLLGVDPWHRADGVEPYRGKRPRDRIGCSLWVFDRSGMSE